MYVRLCVWASGVVIIIPVKKCSVTVRRRCGRRAAMVLCLLIVVVIVVSGVLLGLLFVVHEPIISILVCFLDLVHNFDRDLFDCFTCGGRGVSSNILVFFDDFFDFGRHIRRRHLFVVEIVITR